MHLERDDVLARLPHRPPILMPHRVTVETPGQAGTGYVRLDPKAPVWGQATAADLAQELVLESAAQVLGLVLGTAPEGPDASAGGEGRHLLLGFADVAFAGPLDTTREIALGVAVEQRLGGICRGAFRALQDGAEVARGELTVMQG